MDVTRAATSITVRTSVLRAGSYPRGYTIINQDLNATVWADSNPGLAPGQGTPISPGTSLRWDTDGDLFVVLGNDALSVTAGSAQIILSYDTALWQPSPAAVAAAVLNSGVLIIDKPVQLTSGSLIGIQSTATFDISRYNSLMLSVTPATAVAGFIVISFSFDGFNAITSQTVIIPGVPLIPNVMEFPAVAKYMIVSSTTVGVQFAINLIASTRTVENWHWREGTAPDPNRPELIKGQQVSAGVGALATVTSTTYWGEIEIGFQVFPVVAGANLILNNGGAGNIQLPTDGTGGFFTTGAAANGLYRMALWAQPLTLQPFASAAAQTFRYWVTPLQPR